MPFDGNGNYVPVGSPDFPAVPSTVIRASQYNNEILDIAAALSMCLTRDGQSVPFTNLPMNGYRLTGLGEPAALGDSLAYGRTVKISSGGTASRPAPAEGVLYCNTDTKQFEGFVNSVWQSVGSGQMLGTAVVKAVFFNAQTIAEGLTIKAGTNGGSFGPMTINDGVTVTIEDGATWSIV